MSIFKSLFGKKESVPSIIQNERRDYLISKWVGDESKQNNVIREDSILRVNIGEVAVVFKNRYSGESLVYYEGPCQNPVGEGVYDLYFINIQGTNQIRFGVPFFDVADPRNIDLMVPVSVRGTVTFCINDYKEFVRLNRLSDMDYNVFKEQTKDAIIRYVKSVVGTIPIQHGLPLVGIESQIDKVNDIIQEELIPRFNKDFGVTLKSLDISEINVDKESEAYLTLKSITQDISTQKKKQHAELDLGIANVEADIHIQELKEESSIRMKTRKKEADLELLDKRNTLEEKHRMQHESIDLDLLDKQKEIEERYRAQREEAELKVKSHESIIEETQFAMHSRTEEAKRTGRIFSDSGKPKTEDFEAQMAKNLKIGISTSVMAGKPKLQQTGMMPPKPNEKNGKLYHIVISGQQSGPYTLSQIQELVHKGSITTETMIWLKGTPQWEKAEKIPELAALFHTSINEDTPPPLP